METDAEKTGRRTEVTAAVTGREVEISQTGEYAALKAPETVFTSDKNSSSLNAERPSYTYDFEADPVRGGRWTVTETEAALPMNEAAGVEAGQTYTVRYVYEVIEDNALSDKGNEAYVFSGVAIAEETETEGVTTASAELTNELDETEIVVEKKWTKDGAASDAWPEGAEVAFTVSRTAAIPDKGTLGEPYSKENIYSSSD